MDVDHDRGGALLLGEALAQLALQVQIDGQVDVVAGLALGARQLADGAADGIDLELAGAGDAAHRQVVDPLDAVACRCGNRAAQQRVAGQVGLRRRRHVAEEMGGSGP